jgi:DNA-binding CsgD family transcriptional regulator
MSVFLPLHHFAEGVRCRIEQLSSLLFTSQFLVVVDHEQAGGYVSPQAANLLGYPAEQLSLHLLHHAIHPDDRWLVSQAGELTQEFAYYLQHSRPGGALPPETRCATIDYRLRCLSGAYVRVLRQSIPLAQAPDGRALVTASLFTDITAHKISCDVRFSIDHPGFTGWLNARRATHPADLLSLREQEVLARVLAGGTNASMSRELFISELTLKTHRRNIHRKLKAHSGTGS